MKKQVTYRSLNHDIVELKPNCSYQILKETVKTDDKGDVVEHSKYVVEVELP